MPAERVTMRPVRGILRYRFEDGLGHKAISYRVGAAPSTVRETLRRDEAAELTWPLGDEISNAVLEAPLSGPLARRRATAAASNPTGPMSILKRKHVTLQILWDEYIARQPDGYRYSRFCDLYRGWAASLPVTMRENHSCGRQAVRRSRSGPPRSPRNPRRPTRPPVNRHQPVARVRISQKPDGGSANSRTMVECTPIVRQRNCETIPCS